MESTATDNGVHYLRITESTNEQPQLDKHIADLVSYLDEHGLPVIEHGQVEQQNDRQRVVLAYSARNRDNDFYYATKTFLAECGLDRSRCKVETLTNN